jgi:plastocyanin
MQRLSLIALAAAGILGLAACGGDDADPAPTAEEETSQQVEEDGAETGEDNTDGDVVETVTVTASEMALSGLPETLPAGTIEVVFDNVGEAPHDLVVEELGDEQVIPTIDGGESQTGTVTLEPGTYTFYCAVGNHRGMGMEATVTVE